MRKRSDLFTAVAAGLALLVCCGTPLVLGALLGAAVSATLIAP